MNSQIDVRPILKTIQVPSLVIHRSGDQCLRVEEGRYLAEQIPGAQLVELPGNDHLPFVGHQDEILDAIEQFLTGVSHNSKIKRVLATVLVLAFQMIRRVLQCRLGYRMPCAKSNYFAVS